MTDLKGKNILVTGGAGTGVGAGICGVLSAYGAQVILNDRLPEAAMAAVSAYPGAIPAGGDVSSPADVDDLFAFIGRQVGRLDGLVNNAGVGLSKAAHEAAEADFDRLYGIDIRGCWLVSRAYARHALGAGRSGRIVNISSVHARATIPSYAIYASAKAAVEGLTRGMAVELGPKGIRVNAVAPGYVHAEQNYALIASWAADPELWVRDYLERDQVIAEAVQPEDCGQAVAFLLSDLSRGVTGQVLQVDNGTSIQLISGRGKDI